MCGFHPVEKAWPNKDAAEFFKQVGQLAEINSLISEAFGARRLWVLDSDGSQKSEAEISLMVLPGVDLARRNIGSGRSTTDEP